MKVKTDSTLIVLYFYFPVSNYDDKDDDVHESYASLNTAPDLPGATILARDETETTLRFGTSSRTQIKKPPAAATEFRQA